jgi:hypothetical protein
MPKRIMRILCYRAFLVLVPGCLWLGSCAEAGANDTKTINRVIKWEGEKHVTVIIDIGAASIDLRRGASGDILNARVEYNPEEVRTDISYDRKGDRGEVYLVSERRDKGLDLDEEDNHWDLEIGDQIPISFEVDVGACDGEFDFTGLRVDGLDMDVGASSIGVDFRKPNSERISKIRIEAGASKLEMSGLGNANFEKLGFDGGVGDFSLDFSGDFDHRAQVSVDVGLGSLKILVPHDAGVQIRSSSSCLSSLSIDQHDFEEVEDDLYESDNFGKAAKELLFDIDLGLGSVEVEYTGR